MTATHHTNVHHRKPMPPTYLWQSIAVTILCCLPLGLLAIIFATRVEPRWRDRDYEGALHASKIARNTAFWSFIIGLIFHITIFVYLVFVAGLVAGGILTGVFSGEITWHTIFGN
jgi:hypothetical protein